MCGSCNVYFWGTSRPEMGKTGWIYAIKRDKFNYYQLVINHAGEQEEIPIAFCPHCGRYLK